MIKINFLNPDETDSKDDICIYNIKESDKYKKADYFEISCISWLKNDSTRNFQDLEILLRSLNLESHIIAKKVDNIDENLEIKYPNNNIINEPLEFIAKFSCKLKDETII